MHNQTHYKPLTYNALWESISKLLKYLMQYLIHLKVQFKQDKETFTIINILR